MIALPAELSHAQKQALAREYVQGEFVSQGMIADIGYHDFDSHNPHAHIMLTMRPMTESCFGKKERKWNKRDAVREYRADWAEYANLALERAGLGERIDHRSLKEQGIEREPQIHLGAKVMEMEARGVQTRVGDESRRISKVNLDLERQEARCERLRVEIAAEQVQPETYILPEFFYPSESKIEVKQTEPTPPVEPFSDPTEPPLGKSPVPDIDLNIVRQVGELLVRRGDEIALESSPAAAELAAEIERITATMNEVSAKTGGVFEKMAELLAKLDKAHKLADAKRRQAQLEKGRSPAQEQQEPVQRQEQRAKKRDQEMEL